MSLLPTYERSETLGSVIFLVFLLGLPSLLIHAFLPGAPAWTVALGAVLMLLPLPLLYRMRIRVNARGLRWSFGLGNWPGGWLPMHEIESVELGPRGAAGVTGIQREPEGWHIGAGGGKLVEIRLRSGRRLRISSDDAEALLTHVRLLRHGQP